jgi:hypothetical protein
MIQEMLELVLVLEPVLQIKNVVLVHQASHLLAMNHRSLVTNAK